VLLPVRELDGMLGGGAVRFGTREHLKDKENIVSDFKPILAIDFDGVVRPYLHGWQDGAIYDRIMPGFCEWAEEAKTHFRLVIYSSRSKTEEGCQVMHDWMVEEIHQWADSRPGGSILSLLDFEFAHEKPPAFLTIDDRAIQFRGDWSAPELSPDNLRAFKPWNAKPK
jgi:hypothetical protein